MKRKVLLPLLVVLIAGCASGTELSDSKSDGSENPVSSSSVYESAWGSEYAEAIVGSLGEDLPYIRGTSFECEVAEDDFGDPLICLYVYFDDSDSLEFKLEEYASIARNNGYEVTVSTGFDQDSFSYYDVYFADKVIDAATGIELQFLLGGHNNRDCMGIFAYNYVYDEPGKWPTNLVTSLLGYDIPHLEDTGTYQYTYQIHPEGYIDMVISNVPVDTEDAYVTLLTENGYTVTEDQYDEETGDYLGRFAFPDNRDHTIQFGVTVYGLEIYIFKI